MHLIHWSAVIVGIALSLSAALHALLFKRNPSSALGWVAVCLLFPPTGALLYFLFGINRVRTRAKKLERKWPFKIYFNHDKSYEDEKNIQYRISFYEEINEIYRVSQAVTRRPIVGGNSIKILHNGEEAYPSMLDAIERAERFIYIATYIFETNNTGRQFIDALSRAAGRGVDVRVVLDGMGEFYSLPRAGTLLKKRKVRVSRFLPPRLFPPAVHINLRTHRKILVVDGGVAFAGGMNIGDRHLGENTDNPSRVLDVHFRMEGPVARQLEEVFLEDWAFCTGEQTSRPREECEEVGHAICRTIVDGPNEDLDKLSAILVGAISSARHHISIMTPYFLPSREIISALQSAALRGVKVDVILPGKNNLFFVHWATRNMLWELLQRGVRVYYQPPPFVHSKIFVVDGRYAQIGSANLDPRSLRLNFELVVEIYDSETAALLTEHADACRKKSRETSIEEVDARGIPARVRDAGAWLFSPYL